MVDPYLGLWILLVASVSCGIGWWGGSKSRKLCPCNQDKFQASNKIEDSKP